MSFFSILIVDDNKNNIFTLKSILEPLVKLKIYETTSSKKALEIALLQDINLILLDIQMPEIDGFEVAKLLKNKQKTKDIPIIFLTAIFKDEEFFSKGYKIGAIEYLTKPIDDNLLINKIMMYQTIFNKNQQILQQDKIFKAIYNNAAVGIMLTDKCGAIIEINNSLKKSLKIDDMSLIEQNINHLIYKRDLNIITNAIENIVNKKEHSITIESRFITKDNSYFYGEVVLSPIKDIHDEVINVIFIINDITDFKLLTNEKELRDKEFIQQSKMAAMGEILNSIAHQWRQPLNVILLSIGDLQEAYEFGELDKEYLDKSVEQTTKQITNMSKTIDDFRSFFKYDSKIENFNISDLFKEVSLLLEQDLKKHSIEYIIKTDLEKEALEIKGFRNELRQVIYNIILNARDAIIEQKSKKLEYSGIVKTDISLKNNEILITIEDNGIGIPSDIFEKIFEPYQSTKGLNGTGIGLYMAKIIIEKNLNGKIWADNGNNGAKFSILLKR